MAYCVKCGARIEEGIGICPQCGAEVPVMGNGGQNTNYNHYQQSGYQHPYTYNQNPDEYFDINDVSANKVMAVLSYLGVLVVIPIIAGRKNSEYLKFHMNQGLALFIIYALIDVLTGDGFFGMYHWLPFHAWIPGILVAAINLAQLVFVIVGIVSAAKGTRRELPIIGRIKIFK